jgi:plasmid stability protein
VKNITVSVDDETYRRARTKAAEQDTSLSALVRRFLVELVSGEDTERGLELQERDLRAQISDFSAGDRLSREDVHGRRE